MGCCVSKKRGENEMTTATLAGDKVEARAPRRRVEARDPLQTEEEKVKEVLSETPSAGARPRPRPRRVAGAVAPSVEREAEKAARTKGGGGRGRARRAVGVEHAASEKSEAASESSSVATTATGPEHSPGKPTRKRTVSGELGRDSGPAAPGADRPGGGRASPSPPPPRREPGDRPCRRSPSPAAKRTHDQRRARAGAGSAASCPQRKPPVLPRPCGHVSPRRAQDTPPPLSPPRAQEVDHPATGAGVGASVGGDGKESLENPSVAMECFIFL
ncbi:hypothetical protein GUJ93_ZPchr0010g8032 [Zizania palustris]|uniref:Serine/arginine repetitive matrix protein 1-like n=1 Tax=Zizania palustris TaxID=103762 RepID=A0A8J5WB07_ZIZPA|nr:hypothetical protein GUJ93_ZPchr0010g9945 [Zizania palustris]KAG8086047.1 hypothetical protein GUJ93_ZPchr0010g8032 [Zizania palustris]